MKTEKKKCTKCKRFLLFECFKNKKKSQLTKCCVKCLDGCKKLRQQVKCKHGRQRSHYKDCDRSQVCEHNKQRPQCKDCIGSQICGHSKQKSIYKGCGGGQVCEHSKRRSICICKDCGRSQICEYNRKRSKCKDCGGSQICKHNKIKSSCPIYDPPGHLAGVVRSHVYTALKNDKEMSSTECLGCNIETFKKHIEQ